MKIILSLPEAEALIAKHFGVLPNQVEIEVVGPVGEIGGQISVWDKPAGQMYLRCMIGYSPSNKIYFIKAVRTAHGEKFGTLGLREAKGIVEASKEKVENWLKDHQDFVGFPM